MKEEIWKKIPGFKDLYEVSNYGNVRTYYLSKDGKPKIKKVFVINADMKKHV